MSGGFKKTDLAIIDALKKDEYGSDNQLMECCVCCCPCLDPVNLPCGGFVCNDCYKEYGLRGKCPRCDKPGDVYRPTNGGDNHSGCDVSREEIIDPRFLCPSCNNEHDYVLHPTKSENSRAISENIAALKKLNIDKYLKADKEKTERRIKAISELTEEEKRMEAELETIKSQNEGKARELEALRARERENAAKLRDLDAKMEESRAELERDTRDINDKMRQNESNRQALEAAQRQIEVYEREKRLLEESNANIEEERRKLAETDEENKRKIGDLESKISEDKRRLEELMKSHLDDDDDDNDEDKRTVKIPPRSTRFTRNLQLNVDFTPAPPKGSPDERSDTKPQGGVMRAAINLCQNVKNALPGPTQTETMHDIEEFEVRERLGVWGSGKPVYRGTLRGKDGSYALKKVVFRKGPAPVLSAPSWTSAKPTDEEKCQHSVNALDSDELSNFAEPYILKSIHEGNDEIREIVKPEFYVRDKRSDGTLFYIAMPYYSMDLEYGIAKGLVTPSHLRSIAEQLLRGISYLHSLDIVHRDICASSILIRKEASQLTRDACPIAIAGMGHAALTKSAAQCPYPEFGLSRFHPPECFDPAKMAIDEEFWINADIWAIGCVLAEVALGRKAFSTGELAKIDSGTVSDRANEAADKVANRDDVGLIDCIRKTLVFNPSERKKAIELLNGLGITPNVFTKEQPFLMQDENIRTFILKTCPYISIK